LGGPGSKDLEADSRLGHDDAHLIFGTNAYGPEGFRTARIFFTAKPGPVALTTCPERPPVPYFGTPANPLTTGRGPLARTPVPANTQDAASAGAIVSAAIDPATGRGDALQLWHIDYAEGHLISDGTPLVSRFAAPADAAQPGSAPLLDTGDGRLSAAVSHADPTAGGAEAVWTAQTVAGAGGRSVVRWYEILPAANRVRQAGVVRDGDEWLFDGAISPTRSGDAAVLLLTAVGRGASPSLRVLARTPATHLDLLAGQRTLHRSADTAACPAAVCPWAPSVAASPDPLAPRTVWGTAQLAGVRSGNAPAWITRNVSLIADVAAPTITLTAPSRYVRRGAHLRARYSCADEAGGSGMTSCAGTVRRGARIDTRPGRRRFTVRARDRAGHLAVLTRTYVVDGRAPVVSVRAPVRGAVLRRGARLVARYSCHERGGSGIARCRGTVRAGRRLDTSRRGRRALVVVAADRAGHRIRVVRAYRVG